MSIDNGHTVDPEAFTEARRAWREHTEEKWVPGDRVPHGAAWSAAITAIIAYQRRLDIGPTLPADRDFFVSG